MNKKYIIVGIVIAITLINAVLWWNTSRKLNNVIQDTPALVQQTVINVINQLVEQSKNGQ